jgi:predicted outer membrane repeat protein
MSTVTVADSLLFANSAGEKGGGIFSSGFAGKLTMTGSQVVVNSAGVSGGGIFYSGELTLMDDFIFGNSPEDIAS